MPTVAFLGLGAIGRPMAARLAAAPDIELAVWNRTAERARSFVAEHRARHASTPADAARGASVIITCLPSRPTSSNCSPAPRDCSPDSRKAPRSSIAPPAIPPPRAGSRRGSPSTASDSSMRR